MRMFEDTDMSEPPAVFGHTIQIIIFIEMLPTLRIFFIKWMGFLCVFCSAVFDAACSGAVDICVFILCYAHLNFMPFTSILSLQSIYKIRNVVVSCICVRCRRIERVWFFVKKFACVAKNLHLSILQLWY